MIPPFNSMYDLEIDARIRPLDSMFYQKQSIACCVIQGGTPEPSSGHEAGQGVAFASLRLWQVCTVCIDSVSTKGIGMEMNDFANDPQDEC